VLRENEDNSYEIKELFMKVAELFTEHPIAHKRIVPCPPPTEKTFRCDRTQALYVEILARAIPKPNKSLEYGGGSAVCGNHPGPFRSSAAQAS